METIIEAVVENAQQQRVAQPSDDYEWEEYDPDLTAYYSVLAS